MVVHTYKTYSYKSVDQFIIPFIERQENITTYYLLKLVNNPHSFGLCFKLIKPLQDIK